MAISQKQVRVFSLGCLMQCLKSIHPWMIDLTVTVFMNVISYKVWIHSEKKRLKICCRQIFSLTHTVFSKSLSYCWDVNYHFQRSTEVTIFSPQAPTFSELFIVARRKEQEVQKHLYIINLSIGWVIVLPWKPKIVSILFSVV